MTARAPSEAAQAIERPTARRVVVRVGNAALTLAAVAGTICALGTLAAVVLHLGLILFSTGSMTPAIPAGSVALVREIPAADARTGDVVTVDRPRALPVTHRVVSSRPLGDGRAELVLRGDANRENDPAPYRVRTVRIVLGSIPGGAHAIGLLSSPLFLGTATVGATALIAWAFWPRAGRSARTSVGAPRRDQLVSSSTPPRRVARRTRKLLARVQGGEEAGERRAPILVLIGAAAGLAVSAVGVGGDAARADETTTSGRSITLTSVGDSAEFTSLAPGNTVRWIVGVTAAPPTPAMIRLGLASDGDRLDALSVAVLSCATRWAGTVCPGGARTVSSARPASAFRAGAPGARPPVRDALTSTEQRWLAVDVTLGGAVTSGATARLTVWAWGAGDEVQTSTEPLARTGSSVSCTPLVLAGAAVAAGTGLAALARRRRRT